ncbi:MAG: hypothetical protein LAT84_14010 [Balneolia bacterium]|nr:hypothetical protein [Balneolia bacterium]
MSPKHPFSLAAKTHPVSAHSSKGFHDETGFETVVAGRFTVCYKPDRWNLIEAQSTAVFYRGSGLREELEDNLKRELNTNPGKAGEVLKKFQQETRGSYLLLAITPGHIILANSLCGTGSIFLRSSTDETPVISDSMAYVRSELRHTKAYQARTGAGWFGQNVMTGASLLDGVLCPGPGEIVVFPQTDGKIDKPETQRYSDLEIPACGSVDAETFNDAIDTVIADQADKPLLLALSGGLDSRFLMCRMMQKQMPFSTVSYGDNADSAMASKLSAHFGLKHTILYESFQPDNDIPQMEHYVKETNGLIPCTFAVRGRDIVDYARGFTLIDGSFGEVGRMQYAKKLFLKSYHTLKKWDTSVMTGLLGWNRFNGFSDEFSTWLRQGYRDDMKVFGMQMEEYQKYSKSQFIQLVSMKSRLPWFCGVDKRRTDMHIDCCLPFTDPEVLEAVIGLPLSECIAGRLYRRSIKNANASLLDFPLIKGRFEYKFPKGVLSYYRPKILKEYKPTGPTFEVAILTEMQEYVMSRLETAVTDRKQLYNTVYLNEMVTDFYKGNPARASELETWLTFDIWSDGMAF